MSSKIYNAVTIVIALIGFVVGIVAGRIAGEFNMSSSNFNALVMLGVWLATFVLCLMFGWMASVLANQEGLLYKLNKYLNQNTVGELQEIKGADKEIINAFEEKESKEELQATETENLSEELVRDCEQKSKEYIFCPNCGKRQSKGIKRCLYCSNFIDAE